MIEFLKDPEVVRTVLVTVIGTTLLSLVAIASARMSSLSPKVRHAIVLGCFVAMILMPFFAAVSPSWGVVESGAPGLSNRAVDHDVPVPKGDAVVLANSAVSVSSEQSRGLEFRTVVIGVWLSGVVFLAIRRSLDSRVRGMIWREGRKPDASTLSNVCGILIESGVDRDVEVRISDRAAVPMTWGVLSPRLVLPREASTWTELEFRGVIVHEASHIARLDAFSRGLAGVLAAAHWFNPLVSIARAQALQLAEEIADAAVVRGTIGRRAYVRFLVSAARASAMVRGAEAMARRSGLERRARALMSQRVEKSIFRRLIYLMTLILSVVAIAASAGAGRTDPIEPAVATGLASAEPSQDVSRAGDLHRRSGESETEYSRRLLEAFNQDVESSLLLEASTQLRTDAERERLLEMIATRDPVLVSGFVKHLDLLRSDAATVDMIELICRSVRLPPGERKAVIERVAGLRAAAAREAAIRALVSTQPLDTAERERLTAIASSLPAATRDSYLLLIRGDDRVPSPPTSPARPAYPPLPLI